MDYLQIMVSIGLQSHLTGKEVYHYQQNEWNLTEFEGEWLHLDGEVLIGSPTTGWITESVESPQNSAVRGGLFVENGSIYRFNGTHFDHRF